MSIEDRHGALEVLAFLFKLVGWLVIIGTLLIFLWLLLGNRELVANYRIPLAVGVLIVGSWNALITLATGELIEVFLEIEENTRRAADAAMERRI